MFQRRAKYLHQVLSRCQSSTDPKGILMGITVHLMYYGLMQCVDVLNVNWEDKEMAVSDRVEVSF